MDRLSVILLMGTLGIGAVSVATTTDDEGSGEFSTDSWFTTKDQFTTSDVTDWVTTGAAESTLPPGTKLPPVANRLLTLRLKVIFKKNGRTQRDVTQDGNRNQIERNLAELYQTTVGFSSLSVNRSWSSSSCGSTPADYSANYRVADLAVECEKSECSLSKEIQDRVLSKIGGISNESCEVDVDETVSDSTNTLAQEQSRLGNPCLMAPHACASLGREYTCVFKNAFYCEDLCADSSFCSGGNCSASNDNDGTNGERMCTCDRFHFYDGNGVCQTWWVVLGPAIGVAVVAVIIMIHLCIGRGRKKQETSPTCSSEDPAPGFQVNNVFTKEEAIKHDVVPKIQNEPVTAGTPGDSSWDYSLYRLDKPRPVSQHELNDYAGLSGAELAERSEFMNFKPNLNVIQPGNSPVRIKRASVSLVRL